MCSIKPAEMSNMDVKTRVASAFRAMKAIGISEDKVKPVLKSLLKLYDKNWELIEVENYKALADAIYKREELLALEQAIHQELTQEWMRETANWEKGDRLRASTPQPRKRQPQTEGRKRKRGERGEELIVNQEEIPEPIEPVTAGVSEPAPGIPTPSQSTQFTDISQTLITLQREQAAQLKSTLEHQTIAMERQLAILNEGRLKEKEMELQAHKEADERRIKAEEERDKRAQEFQLQLAAMFMERSFPGNPNAFANLMGSPAGQPNRDSQPSTSAEPTPQGPS